MFTKAVKWRLVNTRACSQHAMAENSSPVTSTSGQMPTTSWCGLVGLKPSLGRIPIDPPFMGRAVGPMTRTVRDAALSMFVLSQADIRDHMGLPPNEIDWFDLGLGLKGLRIGLQLDAGCGMAVDPQVPPQFRPQRMCSLRQGLRSRSFSLG